MGFFTTSNLLHYSLTLSYKIGAQYWLQLFPFEREREHEEMDRAINLTLPRLPGWSFLIPSAGFRGPVLIKNPVVSPREHSKQHSLGSINQNHYHPRLQLHNVVCGAPSIREHVTTVPVEVPAFVSQALFKECHPFIYKTWRRLHHHLRTCLTRCQCVKVFAFAHKISTHIHS